jgi:hypothetical protein
MANPRFFTFEYNVADKPRRWVNDLTVMVEAADPNLTIDEIQEHVTNYLTTGDNPPFLRELRGDISFAWRTEANEIVRPNSEPVVNNDGLKIYAPVKGPKIDELT